jgi:hypothetical protein
MRLPDLRLQQRDLAILTELAEVGVLDGQTIGERHFEGTRTPRACQRRLRLYAGHGLVNALPLSVAMDDGRRGRLPSLYRLSRRGAEVLTTLAGIPLQQPAKRDPRPETLLHRLGVAKMRLAVDDACTLRGVTRPRWIMEYDTAPNPQPRTPAAERFLLYERFPQADGRRATCWPDASCLLAVPLADGGTHPLVVYWEYDRSTERLTQVAAKMYGYGPLLATQAYRKHWPQAIGPTVRVFFVCPSRVRCEHIATAIGRMPGADVVRFTTATDLEPARLLSEPIWRTVDGRLLPILPSTVLSPS